MIPLLHTAISERFRGAARRSAIQIHAYSYSYSIRRTEYCGPFSVWSTTAGPHHSSPTQPPLASGAAKDLFQDCGTRMEIYPWRRTSISALQEVCVPVEKVQGRSRLQSASTGCVDLPRVQMSVGQRSFAFHGPTVWNSLPSALRDSSLSLNNCINCMWPALFSCQSCRHLRAVSYASRRYWPHCRRRVCHALEWGST